MSGIQSTATLLLSPWAAEALSLVEEREIAARAVDLHCRMSVIQTRKGWTIRVTSWAADERHSPIHREDRFHQRGHLADLMQAALDAYERAFVFTGEELSSIRYQSEVA